MMSATSHISDPSSTIITSELPPWTPEVTTATDCTLHQLAPYIGRIKTTIARYLVQTYTAPGELVLDPFCGSGVIPLEGSIAGRRVIAADMNYYGVVLTHAKLAGPENAQEAFKQLSLCRHIAEQRVRDQDLRRVPQWVRAFFHPSTLRNALALRDVLIERKQWFLMSCLLGILHHQRPGFLSYPSSHLVPYLRDRLFPKEKYPDLYNERDVYARMEAKIGRAHRRPPPQRASSLVLHQDSRTLNVDETLDAIITSPPYMNELDYVRDNRLRLWFLDRGLPTYTDIPKRDREKWFFGLIGDTIGRLANGVREGGHVVLIVGEATRGGQATHPADIIRGFFKSESYRYRFKLVRQISDSIPDIRRSRRDLRGTKSEEVLIFQRISV